MLNWCFAVHGSDKMALRARSITARGNARAIVVAMAIWSIVVDFMSSVSSTLVFYFYFLFLFFIISNIF